MTRHEDDDAPAKIIPMVAGVENRRLHENARKATGGTRLAAALKKAGLYCPPAICDAFTDALRACYVEHAAEHGALNSYSIASRRFEPMIEHNCFVLNLQAVGGVAGRELEEYFQRYVREHKLYGRLEVRYERGVEVRTAELPLLLSALQDGVIAQCYPEYSVDYQRLLNDAPAVEKSWRDRT